MRRWRKVAAWSNGNPKMSQAEMPEQEAALKLIINEVIFVFSEILKKANLSFHVFVIFLCTGSHKIWKKGVSL